MEDPKNLEKGLLKIFKSAFTTNCHLDDSSVTPEELQTLEELDAQELLENLRDLVSVLLRFKQEYKTTEKAEIAQRSGQLESMLQRLEGEVRAHISIEHQLKLHIDTIQARADELEAQHTQDQERMKHLEGSKRANSHKNDEKVKKHYEKQLRTLRDEQELKLGNLETEFKTLKSLYYQRTAELDKLKKQHSVSAKRMESQPKDLVKLKQELESRSSELNQMQQKIRKQIFASNRRLNKDRKPMRKLLSEAEPLKMASPLRREHRKESVPPYKRRPASRAHHRSSSDYSRFILPRRAPSR